MVGEDESGQACAAAFLLVRSFGRDDAVSRVQSDPLLKGVAEVSSFSVAVAHPSEVLRLRSMPQYVLVHFGDREAVRFAHQLKRLSGCKVLCLASDIYKLENYVSIDELVDVFIAPTALHREILQAAVRAEVVEVPESIDPIALPVSGSIPVERNQRMCWFGYPESFDKSMRYILSNAITASGLASEQLTLITSGRVNAPVDLPRIEFSERTFYEVTAGFSYALLSHFAFDCHLNSYIKSPNKLITSLVRGMLPLASSTPSYRQLMGEYDLEKFLYRDARDLARLFASVDGGRDHGRIDVSSISADLQRRFSPAATASRLLTLIT